MEDKKCEVCFPDFTTISEDGDDIYLCPLHDKIRASNNVFFVEVDTISDEVTNENYVDMLKPTGNIMYLPRNDVKIESLQENIGTLNIIPKQIMKMLEDVQTRH